MRKILRSSNILLLECVLVSWMIFAVLQCLFGTIVLLYYNIDPFGEYLRWLCSSFQWGKAYAIILRAVCLMAHTGELLWVCATYMMLCLVFLTNFNTWLSTIQQCLKVRYKRTGNSRDRLFVKASETFRTFAVYFKKTEELYKFPISTLMFCGSALITSYISIKHFGAIPFPQCFAAPISSWLILTINVTVIPQAWNIYEKSLKLHHVIAKLTKSKYGKRVVKSFRVFGMNSRLLVMDNSVKRSMIDFQILYTIDLLLLF